MRDGLVDECKALISVTEHVVTRSGEAGTLKSAESLV